MRPALSASARPLPPVPTASPVRLCPPPAPPAPPRPRRRVAPPASPGAVSEPVVGAAGSGGRRGRRGWCSSTTSPSASPAAPTCARPRPRPLHRGRPRPARRGRPAGRAVGALDLLERRPYALGDRPTIADADLWVALRHCGPLPAHPGPHVRSYLRRLRAHPAFHPAA
ncbi:glutathione S-transferase C-terminal domain-containing protein [Streptomyces sp. ISL-86]|uniref:glutathione S-transferase C-terminal domain-containing protein n=1 Tax=Streptomyces sp. ISL-86 TaxID=2819187 RepID=UPI0035A83FCA